MAKERGMLVRFSLYGFLKNQKYYEPFIILAFLEKGLTFFQIGVLIAFREICVNILEIPTGAIADVHGRRRSMIASFCAYILAFSVFAFSTVYWHLFPAMFLFAIGEAFRTGTHKAMIVDWLERQGRSDEKTKVYGFTRSWSQIGSALSAVIAAAVVFHTQGYRVIFLIAILPYVANIVNFLGYPAYLDHVTREETEADSGAAPGVGEPGRAGVLSVLLSSVRNVAAVPSLRSLFIESSLYSGLFKAVKCYLQPALQAAALAVPAFAWMKGQKLAAVYIGAAYAAIYLLSAVASRKSHAVVKLAGGEEKAATWLWVSAICCYVLVAVALKFEVTAAIIGGFLGIYVLQNLWRPAQVSRFTSKTPRGLEATSLSIESQGHTVTTAVLAPLIGLGVDHWGLWPVGAVGAVASALGLAVLLWSRKAARARAAEALQHEAPTEQ